MGIQKKSVSFTDAAHEYVENLVTRGDYPTLSAAVSGELARAREVRAREEALFDAELQRRLAMPVEQWEPVGLDDLFRPLLDKVAKMASETVSDAGKS